MRKRRIEPVRPRVKDVRWKFTIVHVTQEFGSLSRMEAWLRSRRVQPDEEVIITRNDRVIYRGPWKEYLRGH